MDNLVPVRDARRVYCGLRGQGGVVLGTVVYVDGSNALVNVDCDPSQQWFPETRLHGGVFDPSQLVNLISPAEPAHWFAQETDVGSPGDCWALVSLDSDPCAFFWTPCDNLDFSRP